MYKIFNFLALQEKLREMDSKDIGLMLHHVKAGPDVKKAAYEIPLIEIDASIQPITRTVLRVKLNVKPDFRYNFYSNQSVGFLQSSSFVTTLHFSSLFDTVLRATWIFNFCHTS